MRVSLYFCVCVFLPIALGIQYTPGTDTCEGRCNDHYDLYNICQCTADCAIFGDCCVDYVFCLEPEIPEDSCEDQCGLFTSGKPCQCNDGCLSFGDCCDDYVELCGGGGEPTCEGRCENGYEPGKACQCNDRCGEFNNCCEDYENICLGSEDSCLGKCFGDYDSGLPCQCNVLCPNYGNCCEDYEEECPAGLCEGRCGSAFDGDNPCQCNDACVTHDDCCPDFSNTCLNGTGPQPITEDDITDLAESLWSRDINRLSASDYVINKQGVANEDNPSDVSPEPFFTSLNESALSSPTFQTFTALLDNYIPQTSQEEIYTPEELQEIEDFLDAVFETDVMNTTAQFLISKGWYEEVDEFRAFVKEVWFGNYSRKQSDPFFDSSGFEHVFVGEIRGDITGFHNWLQFYYQEKEGNLNYYGYVRENYPNQIGAQFIWQSALKELGSMIVGSSPEFELAMMSLCFRVKPGSVCSFTLDGSPTRIQTYTIRDIYIGSSYFIV